MRLDIGVHITVKLLVKREMKRRVEIHTVAVKRLAVQGYYPFIVHLKPVTGEVGFLYLLRLAAHSDPDVCVVGSFCRVVRLVGRLSVACADSRLSACRTGCVACAGRVSVSGFCAAADAGKHHRRKQERDRFFHKYSFHPRRRRMPDSKPDIRIFPNHL